MTRKNLEFLEVIYKFFKEESFPLIDYIINFQEILNVDIKELLGIYNFVLESGYVANVSQDRIYLTKNGLRHIRAEMIEERMNLKR